MSTLITIGGVNQATGTLAAFVGAQVLGALGV